MYQEITPGAGGKARIDRSVKTNAPQIVQQSYTVGEAGLHAIRVRSPLVRAAMGSGTYWPNRQSILCSQRHCDSWKQCQEPYGGRAGEPEGEGFGLISASGQRRRLKSGSVSGAKKVGITYQ